LKPEPPYERLRYFQTRLGLDRGALDVLEPHREAFAAKGPDFGRAFWEYFWAMDRTRLILEQDRPRRLAATLGMWFTRLFSDRLDDAFLAYLWSSGMRHVEANLDQRFINLGYAMARGFCHGLVREGVVGEAGPEVGRAVDKLLDFCVLVATDSYLTMTSRCDREVIQGIAHQVRNPVTVIGGNIQRLMRQTPPGSPSGKAYQAVLEENRRLERMVGDVSDYTRMFQSEARPRPTALMDLARRALVELEAAGQIEGVEVELQDGDSAERAYVDPQDAAVMVRHLLENAVEAARGRRGRVSVSVRPAADGDMVELEVVNPGAPPTPGELEELMNPFASSKPRGTGFGLPIAMMAARRNLGSMALEPAEEGARCLVRLPRAAAGKDA